VRAARQEQEQPGAPARAASQVAQGWVLRVEARLAAALPRTNKPS
jgi:hypothetical protein